MASAEKNTTRKIWEAPLDLSNFNIIVALLGGWISLFGLVSFLLKEQFYMSEARKSARLLSPSIEPLC
jgi:hypothetical protein